MRIGGVRLKTDDRRMIGHEAGAAEPTPSRGTALSVSRTSGATRELTPGPAQRFVRDLSDRGPRHARLCPVS